MIDGSVGARPGVDNMQALDQAWWRDYHDRVEAAARSAADA
jgi:hypothetical protein